jgi:hypothetical protein
MILRDSTESPQRAAMLEIEDYVDDYGHIVIPDGTTLTSCLDRNVTELGDAVAYRYLDYSGNADGQPVEMSWSRLGVRLRAVGARLQQVTTAGDRVAILAPQGLDYVVGFFAAIAAGNIAVPLFARRPAFGGADDHRGRAVSAGLPPHAATSAPATRYRGRRRTRRGRRIVRACGAGHGRRRLPAVHIRVHS